MLTERKDSKIFKFITFLFRLSTYGYFKSLHEYIKRLKDLIVLYFFVTFFFVDGI